jgi:hypothetical protein
MCAIKSVRILAPRNNIRALRTLHRTGILKADWDSASTSAASFRRDTAAAAQPFASTWPLCRRRSCGRQSGLHLMRELSAGGRIPGIAVSGFGAEGDRRNSHEAGFVEHLTKPIDMTSLGAAIKRATACAQRPPLHPTLMPNATARSRSGFSLTILHHLIPSSIAPSIHRYLFESPPANVTARFIRQTGWIQGVDQPEEALPQPPCTRGQPLP